MNVCIMGLTASGKTSQSNTLANKFRYTYVSGSRLLLNALAVTEDIARHYWLDQAERIEEMRDNSTADREADAELVRLAENSDRQIFDSWTLPWLSKAHNLIRIYLNPDLRSRARMAFLSKENNEWSEEELV